MESLGASGIVDDGSSGYSAYYLSNADTFTVTVTDGHGGTGTTTIAVPISR